MANRYDVNDTNWEIVPMPRLWDKYHPKNWSEVVGQDAAIAEIREMLKGGWGGRAWWIVGKSGTGCTTIARLIACEGAHKTRVRSVTGNHVDAAMAMRIATENPGKEKKVANRAYIIDCPAWLSPEPAQLLSCALPALYKNICVIFTTTKEGEAECRTNPGLYHELIGSCLRIELAQEGLEEHFAKRCNEIAKQEGLEDMDLSYYVALARRYNCSMRAMLNKIAQEVSKNRRS
jgi:hypothetical protein